ncbi:MAG: hypothetical protein JO036_03960 [Candidatus Eremiobacteraeota bacterium]|nr:hypothetical protein [Candidatus Eremiobacteraeota bacterium]
MDALPIKPATPHRPPARAPAAGAGKRPAHAAAHPAAAQPVTAEEAAANLAMLAQQSRFDQIAAMQAEEQREFNALRNMALQQVKSDDQAMNAWIKLI